MSQETVIVRCKTCKRIIFAASSKPEVIKKVRRKIIDLIVDGYDVVHVESDSVRYEFGCQCEKEVQ